MEQQCEKITLKILILGFKDQKTYALQPNVVTDTYRIDIPDLSIKGFLLLKYPKSKNLKPVEDACYLVDKIKLVINAKGKVILLTSGKTVMI